MNKTFFVSQINRLKENYGTASYPVGSINALWQEIGHVSEDRFEKTVTRLLATHVSSRIPPGLDKIENVLSQVREDETKKQKEVFKRECSSEDISRATNELMKLVL